MTERERDPKLTAGEEQWLDRMLQSASPIEPSASLRRAVAEIPLRHPQPPVIERASFGGMSALALRLSLLGALAALAAGAFLGYRAEVLPEVAFEEISADEPDEWEELSLLAFADGVVGELEP